MGAVDDDGPDPALGIRQSIPHAHTLRIGRARYESRLLECLGVHHAPPRGRSRKPGAICLWPRTGPRCDGTRWPLHSADRACDLTHDFATAPRLAASRPGDRLLLLGRTRGMEAALPPEHFSRRR